jgi:hypothetical protein
MREVSKEVMETILEGGLTYHLGYEKKVDLPQRVGLC